MQSVLIAIGLALALVGMFFVLSTDNTWLAGGLLGGGAVLAFLGARR